MKRAYIESSVSSTEAIQRALSWAGDSAWLHAPSVRAIEEGPRIEERLGGRISTASNKDRFGQSPQGVVVGWYLNTKELLDIETKNLGKVEGIVAVGAHGPLRPTIMRTLHHGVWVAAFDAEHIAGQEIPMVEEAPEQVKRVIPHIPVQSAIQNQGLVNSKEEHSVKKVLKFLNQQKVTLDPASVCVEALRAGWAPGSIPQVWDLVNAVNDGKNMKTNHALTTDQMLWRLLVQ